jgi:hypothetical protein
MSTVALVGEGVRKSGRVTTGVSDVPDDDHSGFVAQHTGCAYLIIWMVGLE